jgi:putative phosphoesterase
MKLLVISDTHGSANRAFAAHSRCEPVDAIVHLGDGCGDAELLGEVLDAPVMAVAGNCDVGVAVPRERVWECAGKRILLTHGDLYQVKSGLEKLSLRAVAVGADIALYGHTHVARHELQSGVHLVNPGALANYSTRHSYAVVTINADVITCQHFDLD